MTNLSALSVDELADGICLRAGRIAAAHAELLVWIAEFDRREGWGGPGMLSCAHWLSWRAGMSLGTARDQVRVARRLEDLPQVAAAFADGRVSYSKVRAITRAAQAGDGIDWVELAQHSAAAQLDQLVRGVSRARAHDAAQQDPERAAWRLQTRTSYDEHGNFVLTVRGPAQLLPAIKAGLAAKKAQLQREQADAAAQGQPRDDEPDVHGSGTDEDDEPAAPTDAAAQGQPRDDELDVHGSGTDEDDRPAAPTDADALLALAQDALAAEQTDRPDAARRRRPQLTAQVDPVSGWARQTDGELLPPSSLRAVLRTLPGRSGVLRLRPLTAADLRRFDLGRRTRTVSDPLRALLGAVDGERCRFPGCSRRRKLHAHHVTFWSRGGPTDLANLVLVCSRHHTVLHAQGFQLTLHPDRRLEIHTSDGVPVLHHPAPPWGDPAAIAAGCGQHVSAETLPPDHVDARLDLHYAVAVLMAQAA